MTKKIYDTGHQGNTVYGIDEEAVTLNANGGGQGAKTGLYCVPILTPDRKEKLQNGRRMKNNGDDSFTLTAQDKHGVVVHNMMPRSSKSGKGGTGHLSKGDGTTYNIDTNANTNANTNAIEQNTSIRRLTPIECERLQGFPDSWTRWGIDAKGNKIEISDSQRYKMLGNAVTVAMTKLIFERLYR